MCRVGSIAGLLLAAFVFAFLPAVPGQAQDSGEACPYPEGRKIENLLAALAAHEEWRSSLWGNDPPAPPRGPVNLCNADLAGAELQGLDLGGANMRGANLAHADLQGAFLGQVNLKGANLRGANLEGADLALANLEDTNMIKANLRGAVFTAPFGGSANLKNATLYSADLTGADLYGSYLGGADLTWANLTAANLSLVDLSGSRLHRTDLTDAILVRVDLSGVLYQPATAPAREFLAGISGLESVWFCPGEVSGLVLLRESLKQAGLRDLERVATRTLEHLHTDYALARWTGRNYADWDCPPLERDRPAAVEDLFRLVFFEWTTDYGRAYGRPLVILLVLIGVFSLVYLPALLTTPKSPDGSGIFRIWPEGRIARSGAKLLPAGEVIIERLKSRGPGALAQALQFSVISAFHLGWRDLNVGTWIARLQPRDYALRATGWVRVVSGLQSLLSVYLIAMWVLTYFGRPFG